jgi:hypothetical protein
MCFAYLIEYRKGRRGDGLSAASRARPEAVVPSLLHGVHKKHKYGAS